MYLKTWQLRYLDDTEPAGSSPNSAGLALPSSDKCCSSHDNRLSSTSIYIWSEGSPLNNRKNCVLCIIETWHKCHNITICFLWSSKSKCQAMGDCSVASASTVAASFASSSKTWSRYGNVTWFKNITDSIRFYNDNRSENKNFDDAQHEPIILVLICELKLYKLCSKWQYFIYLTAAYPTQSFIREKDKNDKTLLLEIHSLTYQWKYKFHSSLTNLDAWGQITNYLGMRSVNQEKKRFCKF